jgi:hypothetical protein
MAFEVDGISSRCHANSGDVDVSTRVPQWVDTKYWSRRWMVSAHMNRSTGEIFVFQLMYLNGKTKSYGLGSE